MKELILKARKDANYWLINVVTQSHRGIMFGDNSSRFTASNGFRLASVSCPDISYDGDTCFLRGSSTHLDNSTICMRNRSMLLQLIIAVKEYNKKFNGAPILFEPMLLEQEFTIR